MTATDELRALLDERGVEHYDGTETICWRVNENGSYDCYASEQESGKLYVNIHHATPEQAIAATLGRGTCEIETTENWLPSERYHRCKHCGAFFAVMDASVDIPPCVCPNCGKVVER